MFQTVVHYRPSLEGGAARRRTAGRRRRRRSGRKKGSRRSRTAMRRRIESRRRRSRRKKRKRSRRRRYQDFNDVRQQRTLGIPVGMANTYREIALLEDYLENMTPAQLERRMPPLVWQNVEDIATGKSVDVVVFYEDVGGMQVARVKKGMPLYKELRAMMTRPRKSTAPVRTQNVSRFWCVLPKVLRDAKEADRKRQQARESYKHVKPTSGARRMSARAFYDAGGPVGYRYEYGGKMHELAVRRNGSPYWKRV